MDLITNLYQRYDELVWRQDMAQQTRPLRWLILAARVIQPVIVELWTGMPALRAMSLVYTTLLSLVPLLAVSFSVLKGFGVHNQIEPMLLNLLAPLGDQAADITRRIIGFVENMKAGVLGSVGMAMLIYTIVSLTQKIERAFNEIWRVSEDRPLHQRFSTYLSVILVGPVLVFSAIGVIATMMNTAFVKQLVAIQPLGMVIDIITHLMPYLLIVAAFSFIYIFIPNTKVQLRSALVGGLVASLLWNASGWVFASFIAGSGSYTAVYSAFASLIVFMIWVYLNWLILLIGASIAFYVQHPEYRYLQHRPLKLSHRLRERLALELVAELADNFRLARPPVTVRQLSERIGVPQQATEEIVEQLRAAQLITFTADEPGCLVWLRPLESVSLIEVMQHIRSSDEDEWPGRPKAQADDPVDAVMQRYQQAIDQSLAGLSAADLTRQGTGK